jgi:poly(3-hydroxybutyrate) depolymerase
VRTVALALLLLTAHAVAAPTKAEAKLQVRAAKVWSDHVLFCKGRGLRDDALESYGRAKALDPAYDKDGKLKAQLEALEGGGTATSADAARKKKARKQAAKLYDKLAKLGTPGADDYRFTAIALDPSKARTGRVVGEIKKAAGNRNKIARAGELLARLQKAHPGGDYLSLEADLAKRDVVLIGGKDHPIVGWLSLPDGWKKGKTFPVLVTVDGAGSNFLGAARGSAKRRGKRPWIVLAPCTLVNTNALAAKKYPWYDAALLERMGPDGRARFAWDVAGLLALLDTVSERFGGEEKFAITGFSGGGNLTYGMTLLHPARIRFAMPACANFGGHGAADAAKPENGGPPVFIYTGEKDPHRTWTFGKKGNPGIEPQTDNAVKVLEEKGFLNIKRAMLPGVKHSSLAGKVWETADALAK